VTVKPSETSHMLLPLLVKVLFIISLILFFETPGEVRLVRKKLKGQNKVSKRKSSSVATMEII
jgi:hypothetical protein